MKDSGTKDLWTNWTCRDCWSRENERLLRLLEMLAFFSLSLGVSNLRIRVGEIRMNGG